MYICYKNKLKFLLHKAEKYYYKCKFKSVSGCIRKPWQLLVAVLNKNSQTITMNNFVKVGQIITDQKCIVEHLNDFSKILTDYFTLKNVLMTYFKIFVIV